MLNENFLISVDDYNRLAAASGGDVPRLLQKIMGDFLDKNAAGQKHAVRNYQADLAANLKPLPAATFGLDDRRRYAQLTALALRYNTYDATIIAAAVQQHFRGVQPAPAATAPSATARAASKKLRL